MPTLWDKQRETIVNNESAEIIRMLNEAFDGIGARRGDYYSEDLRAGIDAINEKIYEDVNNQKGDPRQLILTWVRVGNKSEFFGEPCIARMPPRGATPPAAIRRPSAQGF